MDTIYMKRAIELAQKGSGWTSPNPLVGAVIVRNGRIIGEGWHRRYGQLHAEREAFANLSEDAAGAEMYVTLEPCCHHGKQPPCTEAIVEHGIKRVIIGSRDPNPLVSGKGVEYLRKHGVEVICDYMRQECDEINPIFFHFITTGMPYVTMKYAMTLDGKMASRTGASKWITSGKAREHVHTLRGRYSSIMAGIGTVLADDPMLNCRIENAHQPVRIILDSHLRIPLDSRIVETADLYRTIVVCVQTDHAEAGTGKMDRLTARGVEVWTLPEYDQHPDLVSLIKRLGDERIDSLLIEGGGQVHEAALRQGIVNHVCAYIAPKIFGGEDAKTPVEGRGVALPDEAAMLNGGKVTMLGEDILLEYDVKTGMMGVIRNR